MKMALKFSANDPVFAKVRGYPAWPARVVCVADETVNRVKYHVSFYGTGEMAVVKVEDLYPYEENKEKYGKPTKKKGFNKALEEIAAAASGKEVSISRSADDSVADSDREDELVIDEGPQDKKGGKRKRETEGGEDEGVEIKRKKIGTPSSTKKAMTPLQHVRRMNKSKEKTKLDSSTASSSSPKSEVVSRSGRKIKPKKFADEDKGGDLEMTATLANTLTDLSEPLLKGIDGKVSNRGPDPRQDAPYRMSGAIINEEERTRRVIIAKTATGHLVEIKLDHGRPASFKDDKAKLLWENAVLFNALRLKSQIENGEFVPDQIKQQLLCRSELTTEQRQTIRFDRKNFKKKSKITFLKVESKMVELDALIKTSLGLNRANIELCLAHMDEMSALPIDPLFLKKHPHVVETIKKLRRYVGNVTEWGYSEEEKVNFSLKANRIREKANFLFHKFMSLFTGDNRKNFWQLFMEKVAEFRKMTKSIPEEKFYSLTRDPTVPRYRRGGVDYEDDEEEEASAAAAVLQVNENIPPPEAYNIIEEGES